jgi:hypothetical protein
MPNLVPSQSGPFHKCDRDLLNCDSVRRQQVDREETKASDAILRVAGTSGDSHLQFWEDSQIALPVPQGFDPKQFLGEGASPRLENVGDGQFNILAQ